MMTLKPFFVLTRSVCTGTEFIVIALWLTSKSLLTMCFSNTSVLKITLLDMVFIHGIFEKALHPSSNTQKSTT